MLEDSFSERGIVGCKMLEGKLRLEGNPTVKASLEDEEDGSSELELALALELE